MGLEGNPSWCWALLGKQSEPNGLQFDSVAFCQYGEYMEADEDYYDEYWDEITEMYDDLDEIMEDDPVLIIQEDEVSYR